MISRHQHQQEYTTQLNGHTQRNFLTM